MDSSSVVVDGSNIATEGRSTPSLAQLDEAVREFREQFPGKQVIVVVDATFGHRVDSSERAAFDEAVAHGEVVSPPAGAIGRGDAFLLRVAERVGAMVLSNDSFQEFHGEHPWLFEEGRLMGGTPVRGVGWIFTPRTPVRGARSRAAVAAENKATPPPVKPAKKEAKKAVHPTKKAVRPTKKMKAAEREPAGAKQGAPATKKKAVASKKKAEKSAEVLRAEKRGEKRPVVKKAAPAPASKPAPRAPKAAAAKASPARKAATTKKASRSGARATKGLRPVKSGQVEAAIEVATEEALVPADASIAQELPGKSRRRRTVPPPAVNDPLTFLTFVSEHPVGSLVEGTVASFTSHGAMVDVGDMRCYTPLAGLGRPAPKRAREALERGVKRRFVLVALDPARRGAELALPEVVQSDNGSAGDGALP